MLNDDTPAEPTGPVTDDRLRLIFTCCHPALAPENRIALTPTDWGRRSCRVRLNPDEFYVYKPTLRAGRPAILKRGIGGKATKMIYPTDTTVGRTTQFVDVPEADRRPLSLTDTEVEELAGPGFFAVATP